MKFYNNKISTIIELIKIFNLKPTIIRTLNFLIKIKLSSRITIYKNKKNITIIKSIVKEYFRI